jgi:hypothetical protein
MREFSVLIRGADDLPGVWVAHCLNWDLISQGGSPSAAAQAIAEAIVLAIEADEADDLDPDERLPAPAEDWDLFRKTLNNGARVAAADVDRLAARGSVIAAVMYLASLHATSHGRSGRELPSVPPPFMIAALQGNDSPARHS